MKKTLSTSLALLVAGVVALAQQVPLSFPVANQIQTLQNEKASRTPAQQKMDSRLVFEIRKKQDPTLANGLTSLRAAVKIEGGGGVMVDIDATVTQALLDQIKASGGSVLVSSAQFHSIRALLPLESMEILAGRDDVKFIGRAVTSVKNMGVATSEGVVTHQADFASQMFGTDGSGVNVGVLSDSADFLTEAQSTGDLPGNVTVLPGQAGAATGEGTAMMEIIYDMAPGANLFFATADNGPAGFAQNILDLRAAGCDIICDDVFYLNESPFQDGIIAQAADQVCKDGALYFSSCGNSGNLALRTSGTWEGDFADGGTVSNLFTKGGNYHLFGTNAYNTVTGLGLGTVLMWSDPLGASTNDYDLYVMDSTGANIVDFSTTTQNGFQDPFESVAAPTNGERIVVVKASGDARYLHLDTVRGKLAVSTAGNIAGHCAATNVFAVAAVDVHTAYPGPFMAADPVETFSSDGPRRMFFRADGTPYTSTNLLSSGGIVRQKPDIAAADGVSTSLVDFNPFYGTSAAAPHAAAIAALLKCYNPSLTTSNIHYLLTSTALDNMGTGVDINAGWGIIMPIPAIEAGPIPVPVPRLRFITNLISGGNGNGMIDFDECNNMTIIVTNRGQAVATGVKGILSSPTPGVFIAQPSINFPDIPPYTGSSNRNAFQISTTPEFVCGTTVAFQLILTSDQGAWTNQFQITTGVRGKPYTFTSATPVAIPDADMNGIYSDIMVSNFVGSLAKVSVSLFISHPFASDLGMELISPSGQSVILAEYDGMGGPNYGMDCSAQQTIFDDEAAQSIVTGMAPFVGYFIPEQPLSTLTGRSGNAANGRWRLHVWDALAMDTGALECWSLLMTPIVCVDGGGECSGADLSISMSALPNPAGVASPLTYSIVVSNAGPATAKAAYLTQTLPTGCMVQSVSMSQGNYAFDYASSMLNANLGNVPPAGSVSVFVTVIPAQVQVFTSVATVASLSSDNNALNNQARVTSSIENAKADLSISLSGTPNPVLAGGILTYKMTVANLGPTAATNVMVTNYLPANVDHISVRASQGTVLPVLSGNNVAVALLGVVPINGTATVTITCMPEQSGVNTDTSVVTSDQLDPYLGNNRSTITTTVGQAADVAVTLTGLPNPAAISNAVTYAVTVTNRGPVSASSVNFTFGLPSGVKLISSSTSQGVLQTNQSGVITGDLGSMPVGGLVSISAVVRAPSNPGILTASAAAYALENDPNLTNNIAYATNSVIVPAAIVTAGSATLTSESIRVDGVVEPGETVTALFELKSVGTITATNVTATLLAGGGVTASSSQKNYGTMDPGTSVSMPISFTASSSASGSITASMLVQAGTNLFTNVFTFQMPSTLVFSNTVAISIPDSGRGAPYPSTVFVSGVSGSVVRVTATLLGFTHSYPHDVNVLLVDPNGRGEILMSHVAQLEPAGGVINADITLDDTALVALPIHDALVAGTYRPAAYGTAPVFTNAPAGPYGTNLIAYNGSNPNGRWSLYVIDDGAGDSGSIQGGWNLAITTITPVSSMADLAVSGTSSPSQLIIGGTVTNWFSITNNGPDVATSVGITNTFASGLAFVSSTISGVANGQTFTSSWDKVVVGSNFVYAIVSTVTGTGQLAGSISVGAAEVDLNPSNNTAVVTTVGLPPSADLSVSFTGPTNSVAGVNATYNVVVNNQGPSDAQSVMVTNYFPASAVFGSTTPSQGTSSSKLLANGIATNLAVYSLLGTIPANSSASVSVTVVLTVPGNVTNVAVAASPTLDPSATNNTQRVVTVVAAPGPIMQTSQTRLLSESALVNGALDPNETVVMQLGLANVGSGPANNLSAKLLASSTGIAAVTGLGVATVGDAQVYGVVPKSQSVSGKIAFKVTGQSGDPVVLRLGLSDGTNQLPDLSLSFVVSGKYTFSNNSAITIPYQGPASPYPAGANISGLTGLVTGVSVTLTGLSHTFPQDINIALVGPAGQSVVLMSHAGGAYGITNLNLTFNSAAVQIVPVGSQIASGTYEPCGCGQSALFTAFPVALGNGGFEAFNGTDPNGLWSLYIYDDKQGDAGSVAGWSLTLNVNDYVNTMADLGVTMQAPRPSYFGANLPFVITVTNLGPQTAAHVWVTNTVPMDAMVVSTTASQGAVLSNTPGTILYDVGSVAAGGVVTITTVLRTSGPEIVVVGASLGTDASDTDSTNDLAQLVIQVIRPIDAHLSANYVKSGTLQLTLTGQSAMTYSIESSTNLMQWTGLSTNTVDSDGKIFMSDSAPTNSPYRFYRAVRLP